MFADSYWWWYLSFANACWFLLIFSLFLWFFGFWTFANFILMLMFATLTVTDHLELNVAMILLGLVFEWQYGISELKYRIDWSLCHASKSFSKMTQSLWWLPKHCHKCQLFWLFSGNQVISLLPLTMDQISRNILPCKLVNLIWAS